MLSHILMFVVGAIAATAIWFFVLRNNKKKFAGGMDSTEEYFKVALDKVDGISDEAKETIEKILADFKNK